MIKDNDIIMITGNEIKEKDKVVYNQIINYIQSLIRCVYSTPTATYSINCQFAKCWNTFKEDIEADNKSSFSIAYFDDLDEEYDLISNQVISLFSEDFSSGLWVPYDAC
jgi:hypothetical protein